MPLWLKIIIVIILVLLAALIALYFYGNKLQARQVEQEQLMDQMAQTVSILVIDKKIMRIKDAVQAGLPPQVLEQTPKYMRRAKMPVVKAKIGPRVMTLLAEMSAYEVLPVKTECKVVVSGIYIREVKSIRGKTIQAPAKKKSFLDRFRKA